MKLSDIILPPITHAPASEGFSLNVQEQSAVACFWSTDSPRSTYLDIDEYAQFELYKGKKIGLTLQITKKVSDDRTICYQRTSQHFLDKKNIPELLLFQYGANNHSLWARKVDCNWLFSVSPQEVYTVNKKWIDSGAPRGFR